MKIDIHTLCSGMEQEPREPDAGNVTTRAMAKIEAERPARRLSRRLITALAAAAILAALSLGAYAVSRAISVRQVDKPTYTTPEGEVVEYANVENVLQFDEVRSGNVAAFRTGWLPDGVSRLVTSSLSDYLDWIAERGGELPATAMDGDALDQSLTHLECDYPDEDGSTRALTIDVYSAGDIQNRDYLVEGDVKFREERELNGMEALYLEVELEGVVGRTILLYDATRGCAIALGATGSFETLEQVAEGLELVDTDIVSRDLNPDWDWSCLGLGGSKG